MLCFIDATLDYIQSSLKNPGAQREQRGWIVGGLCLVHTLRAVLLPADLPRYLYGGVRLVARLTGIPITAGLRQFLLQLRRAQHWRWIKGMAQFSVQLAPRGGAPLRILGIYRGKKKAQR